MKTFRELKMGDLIFRITDKGNLIQEEVCYRKDLPAPMDKTEFATGSTFFTILSEELGNCEKELCDGSIIGLDSESLYSKALELINEKCEQEISRVIKKSQEKADKIDESFQRFRSRK